MTWLNEEDRARFLISRSAVIQRARALLPARLTRATVDAEGHRSRSPFVVGVLSTAGPSTIAAETCLLVWLAADAPVVDDERRLPSICILFAATVSQDGMELVDNVSSYIPDVQKQLPDIGMGIDRALDIILPGAVVISIGTPPEHPQGGHHAEKASEPVDATKTRAAEAWPGIVFEGAVDYFFRESRKEIERLGIQFQTARELFDAAAGQRSATLPRMDVSNAEREQWGIGPKLNALMVREDLPFYADCSLLLSTIPNTGQTTPSVLRDATGGVPSVRWPASRVARYEFQDRLQSAGRLRINRETVNVFLKFIVEFDENEAESESVVVDAGQLPSW